MKYILNNILYRNLLKDVKTNIKRTTTSIFYTTRYIANIIFKSGHRKLKLQPLKTITYIFLRSSSTS